MGSSLNIINPSDIETVEILRSTAYTALYGEKGANGVIIITTKMGGGHNIPYDRYALDVISLRPKGYYRARQFYSPAYNNLKTTPQMSDLRTTIYWNPDVIPGAGGKATLEFYTADSPGTYRVVIEGLDDTGILGRKVYMYTVK